MASQDVIALIDLDNVRLEPLPVPSSWAPSISALDVNQYLELLLATVCAQAVLHFGPSPELRARLYGGWVDEYGLESWKAELIRQGISRTPNRYGRCRIRAALATSSLHAAHHRLKGTVRIVAKRPRQKMVDELLTSDAAWVAYHWQCRMMMFGDDDDLVPATLAAAKSPGVVLCRSRSRAYALNDRALAAEGVTVASI